MYKYRTVNDQPLKGEAGGAGTTPRHGGDGRRPTLLPPTNPPSLRGAQRAAPVLTPAQAGTAGGLPQPPRPSPKKRRWGIPVEARVRKYPPAQSTHSQVPGDASIRRQWVLTDGPRPPGAARHVGCAWLNRATRAGWRRTAARPRCRRRGALQWEPGVA